MLEIVLKKTKGKKCLDLMEDQRQHCMSNSQHNHNMWYFIWLFLKYSFIQINGMLSSAVFIIFLTHMNLLQ